MRARSVGHACLEIETSGLRIVTDPWWAGPAFTGQWYPWPAPRPAGLQARSVDYLFLSSDRSDHLHPATLRTLRPGATVLVPELLRGGLADYVRSLGLDRVIEMRHGRPLRLRRGVRATCWVNLSASLLVIEDGEHVLVDGNDALHCAPPWLIDSFCRVIRDRHPPIDALFLACRGTSWLPSCIRCPGKDHQAQTLQREELIRANVFRIVERLRPRLACAFPSFVFLEPHHGWINDLQISGPDLEHSHPWSSLGVRFHPLLPGDVVEDAAVLPGGCPRPSRQELDKALVGELRQACDQIKRFRPLPVDEMNRLARRLDRRVSTNRARIGSVEPFALAIELRECPEESIRVEVDRLGARAHLAVGCDAPVRLQMRAETLEAALGEEPAAESIAFGHGALVWLERPEQLRTVQVFLTLLRNREENWGELLAELNENPGRAAGAAWRQRGPLALQAVRGPPRLHQSRGRV